MSILGVVDPYIGPIFDYHLVVDHFLVVGEVAKVPLLLVLKALLEEMEVI